MFLDHCNASTGNPDLQIKWAGTVESRIRQLVMKLEYVDALTLAHPFIKGFDQTLHCLNDEEVRLCASGEVPEAVLRRKKEEAEGKEGASTVHTTTFFIGLAIEPKQPGSTGPRRLDISYPTTEFTKLVKMWDKYDESSMGIVVRHIKNSSLPDYVFEEGAKPNLKRAKSTNRGQGKSNNTTPDQPNKKQKKSPLTPADIQCLASTKSDQPVSSLSTVQTSTAGTAVEAPPPGTTVYASTALDPASIKSPTLPNGESAALVETVQ